MTAVALPGLAPESAIGSGDDLWEICQARREGGEDGAVDVVAVVVAGTAATVSADWSMWAVHRGGSRVMCDLGTVPAGR
jgi:hypothetical protein